VSNLTVSPWRKLLRWSRRIALTMTVMLLAVVAWVPLQQQLLRYRVERLLRDMQSIRLHQSTWQDAQGLMSRWGAWGHYDGRCTELSCTYKIDLEDGLSGLTESVLGGRLNDLAFNPVTFRVYQILGGNWANMDAVFIVQDGSIVRTRMQLQIEIPHEHFIPQPREAEGFLQVVAKSRPSLTQSLKPPSSWVLGRNEQLAEHPDYKVGRPGGCESCLDAEVTYALNTSPAEVLSLTNYQLDCLTSKPCSHLEDLLPAARDWHLYGQPWDLTNRPARPQPDLPQPCRTPVWALGRDAATVIAVTTFTSEAIAKDRQHATPASVRYEESLKGKLEYPAGSTLEIWPFINEDDYPPWGANEHLHAGQKYLLLSDHSIDLTVRAAQYEIPPTVDKAGFPPILKLDQCGVLEDTSQNRAELQRGFAMNDHLRVPEL
jgi:hypothetical protein